MEPAVNVERWASEDTTQSGPRLFHFAARWRIELKGLNRD
jgi:hypothetical protein